MGKIAKNYLYNVVYQLLVLIAPIITAPYLARVLGAEILGVTNYIVTIAGVFTTIGLFGTQNYAIREIAYARNDTIQCEKVFYEVFTLRLLLGVLTVIVYVAFIAYTDYPQLMWIELMYVVAFFIDPCWFYIGMEDMGKVVARNLFAKIANIIGIFVLIKSRQDGAKYVMLLSSMTLLASLLALPPLKKYIKIRFVLVDLRKLLIHLKGSLQLFWPQMATLIYLSSDKIMLEYFVSASAVAYYDQAEKIVKIPLTFITVLSTIMMPRLANEFSHGRKEQVKNYLTKTTSFSLMLALPMMFGIALISNDLVPWYLGKEFIPVIVAIQALSPIVVLCSLVGISGDQYLVATKQTRILTVSYVVSAIVNVIINTLLIPIVGVPGAALGTLMAYGTSMIIQYKRVLTQYALGLQLLCTSVKYFLKVVPMIVVVGVLAKYLPAQWLSTCVQIFAGASVYFITLILTKDETLLFVLSKLKRLQINMRR